MQFVLLIIVIIFFFFALLSHCHLLLLHLHLEHVYCAPRLQGTIAAASVAIDWPHAALVLRRWLTQASDRLLNSPAAHWIQMLVESLRVLQARLLTRNSASSAAGSTRGFSTQQDSTQASGGATHGDGFDGERSRVVPGEVSSMVMTACGICGETPPEVRYI